MLILFKVLSLLPIAVRKFEVDVAGSFAARVLRERALFPFELSIMVGR